MPTHQSQCSDSHPAIACHRQGGTKYSPKVRSRQKLNSYHHHSKRAQGIHISGSSRATSSNLASRGSLWMVGETELLMCLVGTRTEAEGVEAGTGVVLRGLLDLALQI